MEDKKTITIAIALSAAMVLMFVGVIIYARIHARQQEKAAEIQAMEDFENQEQEFLGLANYQPIDVSDMIVRIEDVDMDTDDSALHETEVENTYINTTPLLPSIYNQREKIVSERVDISQFPDSYVLNEDKVAEVMDSKVSVPKEVYLYNTGIPKSSVMTVEATIDDKAGIIKSLGWSSTKPDVVALSATSGTTVTLEYIGSKYSGKVPVSIIITYEVSKGNTASKELTFNVFVENVSYGNDQLKDKSGNLLFLDSDGRKPARVSDYANHDFFYGEIKTTGWQTIDGATYYFDGDSNFVTGHQIIGGLPYEFGENGILSSDVGEMGIDVSKWQSDIDWELVAASGVDFAIIRCGFRGSVSGQLVEDPYFRQNIQGALANGIKVGVYFFTQAITEQEAIQEASMALAMCEGYEVTLPIYIDSENAVRGRANDLDRATRTKCLVAFCETINNSGHTGGVYASKNWYYDKVYADSLEKYSIWVAQYNTECNYTGKTDFWQYSSKETIAGITGYVDVNVVRKTEGM
ncbi:MAG: hypothetical protein IKP29_09685 [Pseudobutyrivibrio sp.]|nr:hypothetical protein [Pseudobutyrivibrio sp.]